MTGWVSIGSGQRKANAPVRHPSIFPETTSASLPPIWPSNQFAPSLQRHLAAIARHCHATQQRHRPGPQTVAPTAKTLLNMDKSLFDNELRCP
jgi:hypothetical protein